MAYGGDFGDQPNDYNFVMDGLCFANHTPTPGLVEYKKAVEPVQTLGIKGNEVTIINRYDFVTLDHLKCSWRIVADGLDLPSHDIEIPKGESFRPCFNRGESKSNQTTGVKPHKKAVIMIDGLPKGLGSDARLPYEAYLQLSFKLKESTNWATGNTEVAWGQLQLSKPQSLLSYQQQLDRSVGSPEGIKYQQISPSQLSITSASGASTWVIDLTLGALTSWTRAASPHLELLTKPLTVDFYRALTDNDRGGWFGRQWRDRRLHQTRHHVRRVEWTEGKHGLDVVVRGRVAPPVLAWGVDTVATFSITKERLALKIEGTPRGLLLPETFARVGLTTGLRGVETVRWFGRGPGESYRDKKMAQAFGNWESSVEGLFVDYEFPQDGGNRTDVRWVEFLGGGEDPQRVVRAHFGDLDGASFSAMHYTTEDLDECTHPYELHKRKRKDTVVRLDWMHHGLGTGSCGPATLPQYELKTDKPFEVAIVLD
jgi:beta-galactosidase